MNALITILSLATAIGIGVLVPGNGASAVVVCAVFAGIAGILIGRIKTDRRFLLQVFVVSLLVRMLLGTLIYTFKLQDFFGGDANTYDALGFELLQVWRGETMYLPDIEFFSKGGGWGMLYLVGSIYALIGRNPLAIQFANAVFGAATAPLIYLCAQHMFHNLKVAKIATILVAFYPSLVLWSSQGLKDAPIVFLLAAAMYATLKLGERLNLKHFLILVGTMFGVWSLRFYLFYMLTVAVAGALVIGMRQVTMQSVARQFVVLICIGLSIMYLGILRTASEKLETYGNFEAIQRSRADLVQTASSGFGKDVDVTTTSGALTAIPVGTLYLLFAPFPWQMANLRQSITLPEMIVWWVSFPMLILGLWFTVKYRLRQALPILIFTSMLTLSYSIFQGNIGTAYRQRSQLLVFYFIFVAVGVVLIKERRQNLKLAMLGQPKPGLARR